MISALPFCRQTAYPALKVKTRQYAFVFIRSPRQFHFRRRAFLTFVLISEISKTLRSPKRFAREFQK
jgi:hypothetical protein